MLWGESEGERDKGIGGAQGGLGLTGRLLELVGRGCANLTHLLRELTDEVLSKLLQLVPL